MEKIIPYKIYLEENEMPKQWYNVRADNIVLERCNTHDR